MAALLLEFVLLPPFERAAKGLIDDETLRRVQAEIQANPEIGDVVAGTGGWRKMRVARAGHGKSGGMRVIYLLKLPTGQVYLFTAYAKSRAETISPSAKEQMRQLAKALLAEP